MLYTIHSHLQKGGIVTKIGKEGAPEYEPKPTAVPDTFPDVLPESVPTPPTPQQPIPA
jgi:hypothetical protein